MYKVIMISPGGVKRDLLGDFNSHVEAENWAKEQGWEYCDENGFVWRLDVVDEIPEVAGLVIPVKEWCDTFLKFREHNGDDAALLYLMDAMENTFERYNRLRYMAIRRLIDALYALNYIIAQMEYDEIPFEPVIEESYRKMMERLTEIAGESQTIV